VRDDGRGGADLTGGSGLLGLKDRAEALGGWLMVFSAPGAGTSVHAELPLSRATPSPVDRTDAVAIPDLRQWGDDPRSQ
jgi:signal transduction histidine kinase